MGYEGFSGNESILYHLESPCRIAEAGEFEPIEHVEWVPDAHVHRHLVDRRGSSPSGDPVSGRRCLMWNSDLEVSLCRPDAETEVFFRNGEGDEVFFVCEGSGHARDGVRLAVRSASTTTSSSRAARPTGSSSTRPPQTLARLPHARARSRRRTATATATGSCSSRLRTRSATSTRRPSSRPTARPASSSSSCGCAEACSATCSTTTRSTSSAGTATSTRTRSTSTTSSRGPAACTCRRRSTRPSRGRTS